MSGIMVGDGDTPNPEEFKIQMRSVRAGEDAALRHDDYVGSYNHTGRKKLETKKWTPSKKPEVGDNAFRADDWMGSGKQQPKTWKVKSAKATLKSDGGSNPNEFVSPESGGRMRKWQPPPKDQEALPPWMSPVQGSISKPVVPKRHSAPIHSTYQSKPESQTGCSTAHNQEEDDGDKGQREIHRQSETDLHVNVSPAKIEENVGRRRWQSHGDIDVLKAQESLSHELQTDSDNDNDDASKEGKDVALENDKKNSNQNSDEGETRVPSPSSNAVSDEAEGSIMKSDPVNSLSDDRPPIVGVMVGDNNDTPDPEQYRIQMRSVRAGEDSAMRHDDFVGAYNHTGRVKLDKKKWTPSQKPEEGDNAFRADDWMGSGKRQSKTWKAKPARSSIRPDVSTDSIDNTRTWQPPLKDQSVSPPWIAAVSESSTTRQEISQAQREASPIIKQSDHAVESDSTFANQQQSNNEEMITTPHEGSKEHINQALKRDGDDDILKVQEDHADVHLADDEEDHQGASHSEGDGIDSIPVNEKDVDSKPAKNVFQKEEEPETSHVSVPAPGTSAHEDHPPIVGVMVGDDDDKPDPEQYKIQMRTVRAGEDSAMRHDDYVGSYNHTGRVKLERKKWNPSKKPEEGDNAFRADDWMGSGKRQSKSWKVKK